MKIMNRVGVGAIAVTMLLSLNACSSMSRQERNTAVGTGVGAVGGAILTGGSTVGTAAGAVIGGVIGHEIHR
jgi:osmotically inducible lipoprotein OsmB